VINSSYSHDNHVLLLFLRRSVINITAAVQMLSGLTIWRIVAGLMAFWLVVLLLMSSSLYQSDGNSDDETLERRLFDAMQNLDALRLENRALKKEAEELR